MVEAGFGALGGVPAAEFWDARYAGAPQIWSGEPNVALVRLAGGLAPGRALDLGCGEGGDAVWLAQRGWQVTGVDVSEVALGRAAALAVAAGVDGRVVWRRLDLGVEFPVGVFELVSAQFLHSEVELPRVRILRAAASAVVVGGTLLVAGHAMGPAGHGGAGADHADHGHPEVELPSAAEVLASLELAEGGWEVVACEEFERSARWPDGSVGMRRDNVVAVRRLGADERLPDSPGVGLG
ncbi:methyltransferase domain-containing protein [Frankia sp. AiPs1]|uniref:class I SAM-dependent methyltransferase n=1 Tax=Frankia sp. AiPs1 TaxID=573493 RepID=UPI00204370C1|nr:methyltransferase domain-containing protein [Frankia sp. AiPs1]MCM3921733.1 methyltransferase domain-containing protein [Frankia sp. AiPs1]